MERHPEQLLAQQIEPDMEQLRRFWLYAVNHPEDIAWAAVFAFVFWLISDLLSRDGLVRRGFRIAKNKLSERSVSKLRERIKLLEKQRDDIAAFLSSDKALYLNTFRIVIAMLVMIAIGAGITVLGEIFQSALLTSLRSYFMLWPWLWGFTKPRSRG